MDLIEFVSFPTLYTTINLPRYNCKQLGLLLAVMNQCWWWIRVGRIIDLFIWVWSAQNQLIGIPAQQMVLTFEFNFSLSYKNVFENKLWSSVHKIRAAACWALFGLVYDGKHVFSNFQTAFCCLSSPDTWDTIDGGTAIFTTRTAWWNWFLKINYQ